MSTALSSTTEMNLAIAELNTAIVETHLKNIENNVFQSNEILNSVPHLLFDDGEVVTECNNDYYTQIPAAFGGYSNDFNTFLNFVVNGKKVKHVSLTMKQAYEFGEIIFKLRKMLYGR
jgi:hypothetical protein